MDWLSVWEIVLMAILRRVNSRPGERSGWIGCILVGLSPRFIFLRCLSLLSLLIRWSRFIFRCMVQSLSSRVLILVSIIRLVDPCFIEWLLLWITLVIFILTIWGRLFLSWRMMESRTNLSVWEVILMAILWWIDSSSCKWLSWSIFWSLFFIIWFRFGFSFSMLCLGSHRIVVQSVWVVALMTVFWLIDSSSGERSGRIICVKRNFPPWNVFLWWLRFFFLWLCWAIFLWH